MRLMNMKFVDEALSDILMKRCNHLMKLCKTRPEKGVLLCKLC